MAETTVAVNEDAQAKQDSTEATLALQAENPMIMGALARESGLFSQTVSLFERINALTGIEKRICVYVRSAADFD